MAPQHRRILMIVLVTIFFIQTFFVYSDQAGRAGPPLSPQARSGQDIWLSHNCQSCHQIYGFGGFLGPDLTNLAGRLVKDEGEQKVPKLALRLQTVLTSGSERMPAFGLEQAAREALAAFFVELDKTGVGQIVQREARPAREVWADALAGLDQAEAALTEQQKHGRELVLKHACIDCHLPNRASLFRSTDLTVISDTVDAEVIGTALRNGVPSKGMPKLGLVEEEVAALNAFLEVLSAAGRDLRTRFEDSTSNSSGSLADLPWFEYPQ